MDVKLGFTYPLQMDIHKAIREARLRKEWSLERLAEEVSKAMKLPKELSYQTVQQWEKGKSAPSRKKMPYVLKLLDIKSEYPAKAPEPPVDDDLAELIDLWPLLSQEAQESTLKAVRDAAMPELARRNATYKRIIARSADSKRVEAKLGTPQKVK